MNQFLHDVVTGLSSPAKFLHSKYFYDAAGDVLFQQIMQCPEYYLTNCELEIFSHQTKELADCFTGSLDTFDVVELGAGDATKSVHLLKELVERGKPFTYFPVDISTNVITYLQKQLPQQLPGLNIKGLNGEYFHMLEKTKSLSGKEKVVLFLGSNIGNTPLNEINGFCELLRSHLRPGDLVLIGFDLQKDPETILAAYNDKAGFTRRFNINLLHRINKELSGNFDVDQFKHFPVYDPGTGTCKSYLVSMQEQQVEIADHTFHFQPFEAILTEVSQKYTIAQIDKLAAHNGFQPLHHFFDEKRWFVDAVWKCV